MLGDEFNRLSGMAAQLSQEHAWGARTCCVGGEQATTMSGTVKDIETMLGPLSEMLRLSQTTETLLVGLNSLAEHVL